jgi:shikimate kinase
MSGITFMPVGVGVVLVGYRGTGKTTVGQLLADFLDRPFVDADLELEARVGRPIRSIFEEDGEPAFRDWEERVIADLTSPPAEVVLATGGGVVLRAANRKALHRFGYNVWLRAEPTVLAERLRGDVGRPALTAAGTLAEIADVLAAREPLYREVADAVIDTDGKSPDEVVNDVLRAFKHTDWRAIQRRGK